MNEITIFKNEEFGEIRTVEVDGKILFCGSDVAKALGYSKPNNAINQHCRCTLKQGIPHPQSKDKTIEMTFITEGDVYRLVAHSKLESAQKFESWVFDEVLPSIRKTGSYTINTISVSDCLQIIAQSSTQISSAIAALSVQTQQNSVQIQENTDKVANLNQRLEKVEHTIVEKRIDELPEMKPRNRINMLCRNYAKTHENLTFEDVYNKLYQEFYYTFNISLEKEMKDKDYRTKLDCAEAINQIKNLEALAVKMFSE